MDVDVTDEGSVLAWICRRTWGHRRYGRKPSVAYRPSWASRPLTHQKHHGFMGSCDCKMQTDCQAILHGVAGCDTQNPVPHTFLEKWSHLLVGHRPYCCPSLPVACESWSLKGLSRLCLLQVNCEAYSMINLDKLLHDLCGLGW